MDTIAFVINNIAAKYGTERAVVNLSNALAESSRKHILIISVCSTSHSEPYYFIMKNVQIIHLGMNAELSVLGKVRLYIKLRKTLSDLVKKYRIDFLAGTIHAYNIIIASLKTPAKKIGCEHMNYDACPFASRLIRRIAYRFLDAVAVLTHGDAECYRFLRQDRLFVIPNICSIRPSRPAPLDNHIIISAGRLVPQKGYDILLEAARKMKDNLPGWQIHIYGNGEMRDELTEKIRQWGLEQFVFLFEPVRNLEDKLYQAGMYVMFSRHEGLGMVLIEAQSCGLPLVSFDCPHGPSEIITDGVDGFLVDLYDTDAMVRRIQEIASDRDLRISMGQSGYRNAARYKPDAVISQWENLFRKLSI